MQGPRPESVNTGPKPRPTGTIDPTLATKRSEDFLVPAGVMFISDVVAEHSRVLHEADRRMKREELLNDDSSRDFNAAQFAANCPQVPVVVCTGGKICLLLCVFLASVPSNNFLVSCSRKVA